MKNNRVLSWEAHLIQRASKGETVAFELLSDLYRTTLHSLAMRILRNQDDANDAVQDTLIKAYRHIGDFDSERPIKPWLCRICTNCCVDLVRSKRQAESLDQHEYMLEDKSESPESTAGNNIAQTQVLASIAKLPDHYRTIIMMRHFQHKEVTEIASAMRKPEGTIKSWLFRARALLKKDLSLAVG